MGGRVADSGSQITRPSAPPPHPPARCNQPATADYPFGISPFLTLSRALSVYVCTCSYARTAATHTHTHNARSRHPLSKHSRVVCGGVSQWRRHLHCFPSSHDEMMTPSEGRRGGDACECHRATVTASDVRCFSRCRFFSAFLFPIFQRARESRRLPVLIALCAGVLPPPKLIPRRFR